MQLFDKWVMLCLHLPKKQFHNFPNAPGLQSVTGDGDGVEQPGEGMSLLVECTVFPQ